MALLCDFHREQAWERWLSVTDHGCRAIKDQVLCMFRRIAKASTKQEYDCAIGLLEKCSWWKEKQRLRSWFGRTWLSECQVSKYVIVSCHRGVLMIIQQHKCKNKMVEHDLVSEKVFQGLTLHWFFGI